MMHANLELIRKINIHSSRDRFFNHNATFRGAQSDQDSRLHRLRCGLAATINHVLLRRYVLTVVGEKLQTQE